MVAVEIQLESEGSAAGEEQLVGAEIQLEPKGPAAGEEQLVGAEIQLEPKGPAAGEEQLGLELVNVEMQAELVEQWDLEGLTASACVTMWVAK